MDLKILKFLLNKLPNSEIVMAECRRVCGKIFSPPGIAIALTVALWVLLAVSVIYEWSEGVIIKEMDIKRLPHYIHVFCLLMACITVTFLTYIIFFKNIFNSWFPTLGFLFYIIFELILIVNTLTMEFHLKYYMECLVLFILLCAYTQVVSWHQALYKEYQRQLHEEYIERKLSSVTFRKGRCERIPLKGSLTSKTSVPGKAGPSTSRLIILL